MRVLVIGTFSSPVSRHDYCRGTILQVAPQKHRNVLCDLVAQVRLRNMRGLSEARDVRGAMLQALLIAGESRVCDVRIFNDGIVTRLEPGAIVAIRKGHDPVSRAGRLIATARSLLLSGRIEDRPWMSEYTHLRGGILPPVQPPSRTPLRGLADGKAIRGGNYHVTYYDRGAPVPYALRRRA